MTRISRRTRTSARWLALCGSLLVAAACSDPAPEAASGPTATSASPTATSPSPTPDSTTDPETIAMEASVLGGGDYPGYSVEAPAGWSVGGGHFVVKAGDPVLGLSVWDVGQVPRHPCHWQGTLFDPGPSVEDLVAALTAQRLRGASTPTDVTLGGYHGRYLEWSVPPDMVVTGDADFAGCDVEPSNGHRDFVSWFGDGFGERFQQVAGQVDRLWILDVEGQRLVVDASFPPDATAADRDELSRVAASLRFVDAAA